MKHYSTVILRLIVVCTGIAILAFCSGVTWIVITDWVDNPKHHIIMSVLLAGTYGGSIPFFISLFQELKILRYIETNRAFSDLSIKSLKIIMYCFYVIFAVCTICGLPFFYYWADIDDAPGLMIIGMAIDGVILMFAVFTSVLKRLLQYAVNVKTENDLTI